MKSEEHIAHVRADDNTIQTLEEHARGVAALADAFAGMFGMEGWGHMLGLLHDKGKERESFQAYIRDAAHLSDHPLWHGEDKKHAWIGAAIAKKAYKGASPMLGYPIMGHHAGLDNYPDYEAKLQPSLPKGIVEDIDCPPLSIPKQLAMKFKDAKTASRDMHHLIRMMFSCLVDADRLDTEAFMTPENSRLRQRSYSLQELMPMLEHHLSELKDRTRQSPLNLLRDRIQQRCRDMAEGEHGIYSLTVPTGGGKTLSSMVWALNHALKNGKKRIIIAIPYTSIVTQTAQILGAIFGQENVLEHHSNFDEDKISDPALRRRMKLATENWDYPIIVTTNVQLLESIFSNRPAHCRKLHNVANSVVIMDEIQTLPLEHFQPILDAIDAYNRIFNVSFLFTTASMPALEGYGRLLRGLSGVTEIIPANWELHEALRRTRLCIDLNPIDEAELARRLAEHKRVLCVVNTRAQAKEVFENLPDEGVRIHLSRMMCSAHLRKSIDRLKALLASDTTEPIRVVSTQLIEAGVDIDFPVVYRQEAGLDSVLQAAGRCNREGLYDVSDVNVFRLNRKPSYFMGRASDAWQNLDSASDWYAPETMRRYFMQLYSRQPNFDKADIAVLLGRSGEWQFAEAARAFRMIDDADAHTVVVNYEDAPRLIELLKREGPSYDLFKRLSQYTVNLHKADFLKLAKAGLLEEVIEGFYYVADSCQYPEDIGLLNKSHWLSEILIVNL